MQTDFPPLTVEGPITATVAPAQLEQTTVGGLPLPASYRAFAQRYGYGVLGNRLILLLPIAATGEDDIRTRSPELADFFREGIEEEWFEYEPDGSPELVERLVPFGISEDGHFFAWDPHEPTGPDEYMIYVVGSKFLSVRRGAPNLFELIAGCLDERVKGILGIGYQPLPANFRPVVPYHDRR
ncbi:MAG TPA: SMI1/KNR4 family protein [Roseiflexaceae bacterium]|nr:SMI1/KNR4 family protein [Roseiflexaceae bacterium]